MPAPASTAGADTHEPAAWGRRLAALVALLAPVAMAVVAAVALAGDVLIALLAVALVLIAIAADWFALTRRGRGRAAGVALALLATAGLIVVVATHWQGVLVLLALLLLLALFGVAAPYALGRTGQASAARAAAGARPVGPARSAALIINLKSGGGKAERHDLATEARRREIEPIVLQPGDDLLELAEGAIDRGAEVIGMAGGDGSQALVATVASRRNVAHVCIPAGTRNHFALDLGLDRDDVVGALDAFTDGIERRVDLAEVNGRVFVNNASLGLYAEVVQSPEYRDAKLKTAADILPRLLGPGATPADLQFTGPGGTEHRTAQLILVSNNAYQLDYIGGRGTRERLDRGTLGLVAASISGPAEAQRFVALEALGQVRRFPDWLEWQAPRFEVRSGGPLNVGIDGEAVVMDPPLRFTIRAGALRVLLPRHRLRASPAAAAVHLASRSVIADLAGIVAGRAGG